MKKSFIHIVMLILVLALAGPALAGNKDLRPVKGDKCPVCGMFVYKYPDWAARIEFTDGEAAWFDGVKDMFKYLLAMEKYAPGRTLKDIRQISVTEYYGLELMDGRKAFYVIGSDVLGPMGHELIPFSSESDAQEFMHDHNGTRILKFDEVTLEVIKGLDH